MRERPTVEQLTRIHYLATQLGLDDKARFARIREITGTPAMLLSQLSRGQADLVIAELRADLGHLALEETADG